MKNTNKRDRVQKTLSGFSLPNFDDLHSKNNPKFESVFAYALNYANYTFSHEQLKKFAQKYSVLDLKKVPDWEFYHIGIMTWLKQNDTDFTDSEILKINECLFQLFKKYEEKEKDKKVYVSLKTKITNLLIGELEGFIDDFSYDKNDYEIPNKLIEKAGHPIDIKKVITHFDNRFNELHDLVDKQSFIIAINTIRDSLNEINNTKPKMTKRIRKPKKINPTKMVKNLNYLKNTEDNKFKSIDPEKIIGANTLWVWDTKYGKLGTYIAKSDEQLSIKGSTIQNFDASSSIQKKIRRSEEKILSQLLLAGKVTQRKILDGIKTLEKPLTGRINSYTILIRLYQ